MSTPRPTPETEAETKRIKDALDSACTEGDWPAPVLSVSADFARNLERERDEARAIVSACMSAMPVGNIQTHTPENLAARIGALAAALAAETSENEAMREAIKEAHALCKESERTHSFDGEHAIDCVQSVLAKLQPFLP